MKLDNVLLERKKPTTFLGIYINDHLNWDDRLKHINKQISRKVGILYRVKYLLSGKKLYMLYNTLILPYISYSDVIWATSRIATDTLLLQNKAIRLSVEAGFRDRTRTILGTFRFTRRERGPPRVTSF